MTAERRRAVVRGRVQGVGLRPFVAALARALELGGSVRNDAGAAVIEVEGPAAALERFAARLRTNAPAAAALDEVRWSLVPPTGQRDFTIEPSRVDPSPRVGVSPDLRVCEACLAEIREPRDRRFGHPFTTCLACGPRFSITRALPYDRARTSMAAMPMCPACAQEYAQPGGRRHHAQALACPRCGPRLRLLDERGAPLGRDAEALAGAVEALRRGRVVALQGVGGFQLLVDATDEAAVARLRA
ncbi:MAG: carbamoyltransferase HypF, partial [Myxococcales bacterium]|nr:carbamoyltransferase HypF [Myxococcales bacterium]